MHQVKFNDLPITDKALLITEFGSFIQTIYFYDYRVHLYSLNHHFVEVYFYIKTEKIVRITIASYSELDKYLPGIILTNLRK